MRPGKAAVRVLPFAALAALAFSLMSPAGEPPAAGGEKPAKPKRGLVGEYYAGTDFAEKKSTYVDAGVDFPAGRSSRSPSPIEKLAAARTGGAKEHSIRWSGQVRSDVDGEYTFTVVSEGSVRLWVDDTLLIDGWKGHRPREDSGRIRLRAERWYDIQLDYARTHGRGMVRLAYSAKGIARKVIPADRLRPVRDVRDPYPDPYKAPAPFVTEFNDYCRNIHYRRYSEEYAKRMELSFEPTFYTLCDLHGYSKPEPRSTALVRAALGRERKGEYREALEIYQKIIEEYGDDLYRISRYGIYVPVAQYCQRRVLRFPRRDRAFYRAKHDGRAGREYEQARRKNSLEGLAQVVDRMLATSVGGRAMLSLGDAALDRGHHLEALEYYLTVRDVFPDRELHTPELALKIAYCRKMLGDKWSPPKGEAGAESSLTAGQRAKLQRLVSRARPHREAFHSQRASAPHASADDYTLFPPTPDPLGLREPVWRETMPGSRLDQVVYTQPVAAGSSIIYRHKNIVYARSILTGELRWKNDMGGRVTWQNWQERQYPQEDVLVQDGLVFTPMYKVGPTLMALEETTGQLKWAYGPMVASNPEQARMRFETAPAGGPRTVYAGYVLDNIEGEAHIDTEYGVMAFESTTGRLRWRRPVCRLKPGLFTAGFAVKRRNRIRSFNSPPLYHQGTVYYNTNAGAITAIDALSGRVKWVMRYPYYAFPQSVHDATRQFGDLRKIHGGVTYCRPHRPMFWLNQRPLLVGERLYVLPVDTRYMFCLDRRSGRVMWSRVKMGEGFTYFLGPMSNGDLVMVTNGRNRRVFGSSGSSGPPVVLLDPKTGQTKWKAPNLVMEDQQPVMRHYTYNSCVWFAMNQRWFENSARPFMSSDDRLYIPNWSDVSIWWRPGMHVYHLAALDLAGRKLVGQRRYYTDAIVVHADWIINEAGPKELKELQQVPHKDKRTKEQIKKLKEILPDSAPENRYGPFMPFSRLTFRRYGTTFELRTGPRSIALVYDREAVKRVVASRADPGGLFARAELCLGESRLREAAGLMKRCLSAVSSEDVDFRALVNQQLYKVHRRLARGGVRAGRKDEELAECLGMRRTVSTLSEEIETLLALAEAYERRGDLQASARLLRSVVSTYGHYEYPTPSLFAGDLVQLDETGRGVITAGERFVSGTMYARELTRALGLNKRGMPLYFSTLSPLEKDLMVRAGELAAGKLMALQKRDAGFAREFEGWAEGALRERAPQEQLYRLWEFPATRTSQRILDGLFAGAGGAGGAGGGTTAERAALRLRLWWLADAARVCGLEVPKAYRSRVLAPPPAPPPAGLSFPLEERKADLSDARGTAWLVAGRRGRLEVRPELAFLAGRVRKKFDNKFVLHCVDARDGKVVWKARERRGGGWFEELRLRGKGSEPGFSEVFVHGGVVVTHGLFDVLAFNLSDGRLKWRYRVPFDFEIKHAVPSGDLLVLAGKAETLALYLPTEDPRGEVVWQQKEEGDLYISPYFHGDRLVSVRKLPFNVTVRYRATGKLMGRLALPDLSLNEGHPLVEGGHRALPAARDGKLVVVSDDWYYIAVDIEKMKVTWKRLIDNSDPTREPTMRFCLKGEYLAVIKEDFDWKSIYMLSSRTGELLWHTDPKDARSARPIYSMVIEGEGLYGIKPHPGQGFYFTALDCKTGKQLYRPREQKGYGGKPEVELFPRLYGDCLVARVKDRQDFELKAFGAAKGRLLQTVKVKGTGCFGEHGRASAAAQNGALLLLGKNELRTALKQ